MKSSHSILTKGTVVTCMLVVHFVASFIKEDWNSYLELTGKFFVFKKI